MNLELTTQVILFKFSDFSPTHKCSLFNRTTAFLRTEFGRTDHKCDTLSFFILLQRIAKEKIKNHHEEKEAATEELFAIDILIYKITCHVKIPSIMFS